MESKPNPSNEGPIKVGISTISTISKVVQSKENQKI